MRVRIINIGRFLLCSMLLLGLISPLGSPANTQALASSAETKVTVQEPLAAAPQAAAPWCLAGQMNGWSPAGSPMYDDGTHGDLAPNDGVFTLDYVIAAAERGEWKVKDCTTWDVTYPPANSWYKTSSAGETVKFTFDTNDHSTDAGWQMLPVKNIATVQDSVASYTMVGNFQSSQWTNNDPATLLQPVGFGLYWLTYTVPTTGSYIGKLVHTGTWDKINATGRSISEDNLSFSTTSDNQIVFFLYDARSGRILIVPNRTPAAGSWCVAGDMNIWSANGNPLYDDGTHGDLIPGDGIFSTDITVAAAGESEWKVKDCANWTTTFPASNSWLSTASANQVVKFTFDINDHTNDVGLKYLPATNIINAWDTIQPEYVAVGDWQGWNNSNAATALSAYGGGVYYLPYTIADVNNNHMWKAVRGGTWKAWGIDNRRDTGDDTNWHFPTVAANTDVRFYLDISTGRIGFYLPHMPALDNFIEMEGLAHDSHADLYRAPFGSVVAGDTVTLRFRTIHNDVEQVKVRFWDTATSAEFFGQMSITASGVPCYEAALAKLTCDYWQLLVPTTTPGTLYYRFIVRDGTKTAYYADDGLKYGGIGLATDAMADNSYVITIADPGFTVNPWMKGAVVYQVFPDRFRDSNSPSQPDPNDNRYGAPADPNSLVLVKPWNELPEGYCRGYTNPAEPCTESPKGRDYFGGDLLGLTQKLPYLEALGVKVIYLNPVFESGSNHGYDTQDYLNIEHFFGNNADFAQLATEAHSRGMKIILDGVFNHVSSDSPYMDRFGHYAASVGACESLSSPYRDWFTFHEVTPGTGACVGTGGANSANYDSWWGFDSIPVLNKNNQGVKDLIYNTNDAVARYWLNLGADGWRLDVMGDTSFPAGFWQAFRAAVLSAKPDAIIIGELWKKEDVLPMVHGDIADTSMNYRFRNAIQGFFGVVDNKGFPDDNQSNQAPSLFAEKFISVREDNPDAAYYTLMNLMDSHDTQRILWNLTPGANNREEKEFNQTNLDMGKTLLRLAVVVQMTTPGAPTIYYGDEVGVTGYDDPDDRRTFPWAYQLFWPYFAQGQGGSAPGMAPYKAPVNYYGALGDHALLDFYRTLTAIRNNNPVFKDGELSFLLTDDTNRTLAYAMRTDSAAAIVALNRNSSAQTLTINVKGLLPDAVQMSDATGGLTSTLTATNGVLTVNLPGLSAAVLLPVNGQDLSAPTAPSGLIATPGNGTVGLDWADGEAGATYNVYRSYVTGGGYELLTNAAVSDYADASVKNGVKYYYVVRAVDSAGNEGPAAVEAHATPAYPIGYAALQWPFSITQELRSAATESVYGQVYAAGVTDAGGDPGQILAQLGFGAAASDPSAWTTWKSMAYNKKDGNNFEYMATLRPEATGVYDYAVRFSTDNGESWSYGGTRGVLTINPSTDTTPPAAPANLVVADWSASLIKVQWDSVADAAEYWLYRHAAGSPYGARLAVISAPTLNYTDIEVASNITYTYKVVAVDAGLNLSLDSNEVSHKAEPKMVNVTFRVKVPAETPAADLIYIAGDSFAQFWNPGNQPLVDQGGGIWEWTTTLRDGATIQYKYARGSWNQGEWWGTIVSTANRSVAISYGTTGNQLVDNTATDWGTGADSTKAVQSWRDPLVISTAPANSASGPAPATVNVTFAADIQTLQGGNFDGSIVVKLYNVAVPGAVTSPDAKNLVWTPSAALAAGTYTVTVDSLRSNLGGDSVNIQTPYVFTFTVTP